MKKIVVLTGAGISAESGIPTFRDSDGLWEGHDVMEVASPMGWKKNKELVLDFYNQRRKHLSKVEPNLAHKLLKKLEEKYEVVVVTQNVDDLHERAGSSHIIHLHGSLLESRSTLDQRVYPIDGTEINLGDKCPLGAQLRPNIVWFGEAVPKMEDAVEEAMEADVFLVVGTSLQVYPAAGLMDFVRQDVPVYVLDVKKPEKRFSEQVHFIEGMASEGMLQLLQVLGWEKEELV